MFYGLLLEDSTFAKLDQEAMDGKAVTREDESWLLGLEAWVPCFAVPAGKEKALFAQHRPMVALKRPA
jgi:hypothetical protein